MFHQFNRRLARRAVSVSVGLAACTGLSLALAACGLQKSSERLKATTGIIGGREVAATEPIARNTAMLLDMQQQILCTASILNSHWLVTAGHCVYSSRIDDLVVVFSGTSDDFVDGRTPRSEMRRVSATFTNPQYSQTVQTITAIIQKDKAAGRDSSADVDAVRGWGDIGLVQIVGTVPAEKSVAEFLPANTPLTKGEDVTIAGYGQSNSDLKNPEGAGVLREVGVSLLDPAWGTGEILLDNTGNKGSCHGDSGGPAFVTIDQRQYLVAVTSHLVGDSLTQQCQHSAAYTGISAYQDWITSTMNAHASTDK